MSWFSFAASIADIGQRYTPLSGDTILVPTGVTLVKVDLGALIALLNITFPANPVDNQRLTISSRSPITVLNLNGNGATINGGIATLVANSWARYSYDLASNSWFRTG